MLALILHIIPVTPIRVDENTIWRAGSLIRPSTVRFRDEDGGGYMAHIEVVHQLRCLVSFL